MYYRYLPDGSLSTIHTKAGTMAVIINITGGMKYRFEVSATTTTEGLKVISEENLPEYG